MKATITTYLLVLRPEVGVQDRADVHLRAADEARLLPPETPTTDCPTKSEPGVFGVISSPFRPIFLATAQLTVGSMWVRKRFPDIWVLKIFFRFLKTESFCIMKFVCLILSLTYDICKRGI